MAHPKPKFSAVWANLALAAVIIVITVIAFSPAFQAGWIWDDNEWVWGNPLLWSPDGWVRMWLPSECPSQYFPLTYASFRLEYGLWGLNPVGFHAVNIVMHAATALLIWLLLARLSVSGAWIAAAIWAVHPVQVESVAWVTERKNVLSTFFYVLALLSWNGFLERSRRWRIEYVLAFVSCALALLAKTTACTIPAVMLLMLWWKRLRIDRWRLVQILPFALVSSVLAWVSVVVEHGQQGTAGQEFDFSAAERILISTRAIWFYLGKLVLPRDLSFSYPQWALDVRSLLQYLPAAAVLVVAVVLWVCRKRARGLIGGLGFFIIVIGPMLGLISFYTLRYTFVADHYQYLACLGPIALVTAGIAGLRHRVGRSALVTVVLAMLTTLSFQQSRVYKNEELLWKDVLAKNPDSWMAYNNLGKYLYDRGETEKGMRLMRKSLKLNERNAEAQYNVGAILLTAHRLDESIKHLTKALEIRPTYAKAHAALAVALVRKGLPDEAVEHGKEAVGLAPQEKFARLNLGIALAAQGRIEEAAEQFRAAAQIDPNYADAHYNLGNALLRLNRFEEAQAEYEETVRLNPESGEAHMNLALLAYLRGDFEDAWANVGAARRLGVQPNPQFLMELSRKMRDPDQ